VQLRKGKGAENNPHRLDSTTEETVHLVPVPLGQADVKSTIGPHDPCYTKTFSNESVLD
jgi:hypothetical protein